MFTWQIDLEALQRTINEQFMPAIGEGIEITKDWWLDLFSRYVSFVILQQSLTILFLLATMGFFVVFCIKQQKKIKNAIKTWEEALFAIVFFVWLVLFFCCLGFLYESLITTIEVLYIPEVYIYNKLT